jgi:hypothetical protein
MCVNLQMHRLALAAVVMTFGCNAHDAPMTAPTAVAQPPLVVRPRPLESQANWTADAVVTALKRGGSSPCGWGTTPGEKRSVLWRVTVDGNAVTLDEDMGNWPTDDVPYKGTLNGVHFTASYRTGDDYLRYVCQFRGGTLTGTFNADLSTFDAVEIVVWGPPEDETTVERHWTGRRS